MSGTLQVGGVTLATHTESPSTLTLDSGVVFPSGHILQVQYTQFTSTAVMTDIDDTLDYVLCDGTAGSGTEILTIDITPISTSSKFGFKYSGWDN